jgi:ribosomal protein L40E
MDPNIKKPLLISVTVACVVLAAAITYMTRSGTDAPPDYLAQEMTWVRCRKPDCEAFYQINLRDYHVHVQKHHDWQVDEAPPLTCTKCGEPSVYRAVKCRKCELVFEMGSIPSDYNDRCPKCRYSKLEERAKGQSPLPKK